MMSGPVSAAAGCRVRVQVDTSARVTASVNNGGRGGPVAERGQRESWRPAEVSHCGHKWLSPSARTPRGPALPMPVGLGEESQCQSRAVVGRRAGTDSAPRSQLHGKEGNSAAGTSSLHCCAMHPRKRGALSIAGVAVIISLDHCSQSSPRPTLGVAGRCLGHPVAVIRRPMCSCASRADDGPIRVPCRLGRADVHSPDRSSAWLPATSCSGWVSVCNSSRETASRIQRHRPGSPSRSSHARRALSVARRSALVSAVPISLSVFTALVISANNCSPASP